jgi:hypothetical protein
VCHAREREYPSGESLFAVVLLAAAVVLVAAAQWPALSRRLGGEARGEKRRARRKSKLRVVDPPGPDEDFVRAVERDLAALPTTDEQDARNR